MTMEQFLEQVAWPGALPSMVRPNEVPPPEPTPAQVEPVPPLKLADYFSNGTGVYELDAFSKNTSNANVVRGVFVSSALLKGWTEIVLENNLDIIDTWHLDGYSFFVVGYNVRLTFRHTL